MAADGPGKVVGELVALFHALNVGVRLAPEICEAGNVDGRVGASWNLRVVEVRKSAARILEAEFIHLVVADGPGVLRRSRHIAIGLLRCARVCVLPGGLVLAADFDSGDRAGAHVRAQRQAVVAVDVVIDTQRIKTGAFKYREVSGLRGQRLIGTRNEATARSRATGGESGRFREARRSDRRGHAPFTAIPDDAPANAAYCPTSAA